MSIPISNQQILDILEQKFDQGTLERGLRYFKQGRVLSQREEHRQVITKINGSGRQKYQQTIDFYLKVVDGGWILENYCTCPVAYNCKHMVAALHYYMQGNEQQSQKIQNNQFNRWLSSAKLIATEHRNPVKTNHENTLHYILTLKQSAYGGLRAQVEFKKSKWLKANRWGKGTEIRAHNIDQYMHQGWLKPIDGEIANMFNDGYYVNVLPFNQMGAFMLHKMVETGRCYFNDNSNPPLSFGEDKDVIFEWIDRQDGRQLDISFNEEGEWQLLATDPLYYLDMSNQKLGLIKQPLPTELFLKLMEMPVLNEEQQQTFSQFTLEQLPPKSLPTPIKLDITPWQGQVAPVLTLLSVYEDSSSGVPLLRLQFEYAPMLLDADEELSTASQLIKNGDFRWQLNRDNELEQACIERLLSLGFVSAKDTTVDVDGQFILYAPCNTKEQLAAVWFYLEQQFDDLKAEGWKIISDESYGFDFSVADSLEAEVEEHDNGWFDLGFNVSVKGQVIPLLPLILQWLEQKNPNMPLLIEGKSGQWQEVPKALIQPVLDTLMELYQDPKLNDNGQLLMPRQQAHNLNSLSDEINLEWQGGDKIRELGDKLRNFAGIEPVPMPKGVNAELRQYQQEGLNWLNFLREYGFSGILADDMGLGKTLQALTFLQHEQESGRLNSPSLIVAPTSVLSNWQNEAQKFCPELSCHIHHGIKRHKDIKQLNAFKLIITSYALLQRDLELFKELGLYALILDEAQTIKNAKAKSAQAARDLPAEFRVCLTGTPMENHLGEVWSLFHFLMPGFLSNERQFNRLFRNPIEKRGEKQPMKTLIKRLEPFILRRTKTEVATELPPKTEMIRRVEMGNEQGKLYETVRLAMEKKVNSLIQRKGVSRSHIEMLDALLKLRQICCDPQLLKLESAKKVKQSAKLDTLMEMLVEQLEEGRKILLFSQFTGMLSIIEAEVKKRNISYSKLTGQTRKRGEQIDKFQSGEVPLFLISLKAGGTGLNLTAADTVIHYDPWWNPAAENQATDRAYRIGQDKPVFVYKLVTENSVEDKILELQQRKQALADDLYGEAEQEPMKKLGADELLALFS